ncbi:hypothetical protein C8Q74DRAFT_592118 [Fomes fomentarius]|nr:hypothetical protein C8Q74DRAFT_592118 [Fomes fomentarius]
MSSTAARTIYAPRAQMGQLSRRVAIIPTHFYSLTHTPCTTPPAGRVTPLAYHASMRTITAFEMGKAYHGGVCRLMLALSACDYLEWKSATLQSHPLAITIYTIPLSALRAASHDPQMPPSSSDMTRLQVGAIYLLLFIRDRDIAKGFHWALYHHRSAHGGYKFNVKQMGSGWICDSAPNNGIMNSFLLDGALRIGFCDPARADDISWIDQVALTVPPAPFDIFTCRTWTLHCVCGLIEQGYVKCSDLSALEQEAKDWAASHHESAHDGILPRPVDDPRLCAL